MTEQIRVGIVSTSNWAERVHIPPLRATHKQMWLPYVGELALGKSSSLIFYSSQWTHDIIDGAEPSQMLTVYIA